MGHEQWNNERTVTKNLTPVVRQQAGACALQTAEEKHEQQERAAQQQQQHTELELAKCQQALAEHAQLVLDSQRQWKEVGQTADP